MRFYRLPASCALAASLSSVLVASKKLKPHAEAVTSRSCVTKSIVDVRFRRCIAKIFAARCSCSLVRNGLPSPGIAQQAREFMYAVSRARVTGERDKMTRDAEALVKHVRLVSDLPVAVGFGILTPEQVRAVWRFADAAVIGSAIVRQIEKLGHSHDLVMRVAEFVRSVSLQT